MGTMICPYCGAEMVLSTAPIVWEIMGDKYSVDGMEHDVCPGCGEECYDGSIMDELESRFDKQVRERNGLLYPDEIRAIKDASHLTVSSFATLIGVSDKMLLGFVAGWRKQSKDVDQKIREIRDTLNGNDDLQRG